jgi:hypothetical protein
VRVYETVYCVHCETAKAVDHLYFGYVVAKPGQPDEEHVLAGWCSEECSEKHKWQKNCAGEWHHKLGKRLSTVNGNPVQG